MKIMISPEGLEVANAYLETGSIKAAADRLFVSPEKVSEMLGKSEVKRYVDNIYLDMGYRNRFKMANLLDEIIESKLEEARESEQYSSKDLVDILALVHKMKMAEVEAENKAGAIRNQTNVQINEISPFGSGNYGALMKKLLGGETVIVED